MSSKLNRCAIVTGGSSGLGKATVESLLENQWKVVVADVNEEAGRALETQFGKEKLAFFTCDVTDEVNVKSFFEQVKTLEWSPTLCVNCAGIAPAKRTLDREGQAYDLALFSKVININLVGTFNVAKEAAALMAQNTPTDDGQRGVIVNTASVAGYEGQIGQTAYAASKGGIIGLTLPMARDLAPLGIRVNTIAPGVMGTPMMLAMPEKVQDALKANVQNPKRLGFPAEFGMLVQHMHENSYMNGETVRLDGALRMPPK